jgi:hypothetical protein
MTERPPVDLVEVGQIEVGQIEGGQRGGAVDPGRVHHHVKLPEAMIDGVENSGHRLLVGKCRPPMPRRAARAP